MKKVVNVGSAIGTNFLNQLDELSDIREGYERSTLRNSNKELYEILAKVYCIFEDMNKNLREAAKSGSGLKVIGAGFKEIFKGIGSALKDPLVQGAILVGTASKLYHLFSEFNKESVELARNFGLTTKEGAHLQHHFEEIASSSTSLNAK